jgi:hypothetical protein
MRGDDATHLRHSHPDGINGTAIAICRKTDFWDSAENTILRLEVAFSTRNANEKGEQMSNGVEIKWLPRPEEKDYPAAESYLLLIYESQDVQEIMVKLRKAPVTQFKAKDIFRASGLSLLGVSNSHVEKDQKKIKDGKGLSPILLVRDSKHGRVVIADGYHRMCAVYSFNEDECIPCKIV